ncbi:DMT family transporter [Paraburkholderia phenoliruptrix]|uniref:DMT family transporter n=1 Tax=Paraburkholderia phenoliruptrix TaxID=252970 RepID=UPI001CB76A96|nr:DMT family transporter [Paraburkholderia phenoliruptrix]
MTTTFTDRRASASNHMPLPVLEAAMVLTWSSGFVGMRFSADYAPVYLVMLWRFVVLSIGLFPFVAREMLHAGRPVLVRQACIGTLAMAGYLAGVAGGIQHGVPAGLAALIADLLPIGVVLMSACLFNQRSPSIVWAGLGLGLAGTLTVCRDAVSLGAAPAWAYALPVAGMLSLAAATVWQQCSASQGKLSPLGMLWLQSFVSSPIFLVLQASQGPVAPIPSVGFAASVAWTAILATLGGCGLYWACLQRSSSARVTSVLFLSPPVTMVWAWAMFREPLSWLMVVGTVISGVGILLVINRASGEAREGALACKGSRRPG